MKARIWLVGLVVAVASGLSDVFVLGFVDPVTFNLDNLKPVLTIGVLFGIKAGLFYVREHGRELADPDYWHRKDL
jgi:hydrogenase/urease accessory protein HupE